MQGRCRALEFWRPRRLGGPGGLGGPPGAAAPSGGSSPSWREPVVPVLAPLPGRTRLSWAVPGTYSAASRSQPQWQGVHHDRKTNVRAGTEIKVTTERPSVNLSVTGTGQGLVGDLRAAGIHHCGLGYVAGQPGCAAQGQRHLVLQGQGCALGEACLRRRQALRRPSAGGTSVQVSR